MTRMPDNYFFWLYGLESPAESGTHGSAQGYLAVQVRVPLSRDTLSRSAGPQAHATVTVIVRG